LQNNLDNSLGLAITLKVGDNSGSGLATILCKVVTELICVKLASVVKHYNKWYPKACYDILLNKLAHFSHYNTGYGLNLYPLGEVVNYNQKAFALPCGS